VPEVDVGVPQVGRHRLPGRGGEGFGQRRQAQPVDLRGKRAVPAQPGAVPATAPAGGGAGHAAEPGQEGPHRCGQPWRRAREPGGGAQQVDREVGGERDRHLQVGVGRGLGGTRGQRRDCGRDGGGRGDRAGGPVRPTAEPVDPQRGGAPGEVRAVGAGTPGRDAATERAPPGRAGRTGGRRPAGFDAEHTDREADGESDGEVRGAEGLRRTGHRGTGPEQARAGDGPGRGQVPPRCRCHLDRHVPYSREVVAAAGEGTAGKEKSRDDGACGPAPGTSWSGRVTEPLRDPLPPVDDPAPGPVTCRLPAGKDQVGGGIADR
jgi:hypothetical protein